MKEAEQFAEEDKKKKESIDAKNNAESLVYQARKTIEEADIEGDQKDELEAEIKKLEDAIATDDAEQIKAQTEALQEKIYSMSEQMYQANAGAEGAEASDDGDDVVDADYEVIDDEE